MEAGELEEAGELSGSITERIEAIGEQVTMELSERLDARLQEQMHEQMQQSRDEVAELRTRLVKTERTVASLSGSMLYTPSGSGRGRGKTSRVHVGKT